MKYSENLERVMSQVREFQPALADMLEKYVLREGDSFLSDWGKEAESGQVYTSGACLFLYPNSLEMVATAKIAAAIANSVTEYDYCRWCHVTVMPMADGCRDYFSLQVKANWSQCK